MKLTQALQWKAVLQERSKLVRKIAISLDRKEIEADMALAEQVVEIGNRLNAAIDDCIESAYADFEFTNDEQCFLFKNIAKGE